MIFLDMTKAFGPVPHERLPLKIKPYGLADPLYSWFVSFSSVRYKVVSINGPLVVQYKIVSSAATIPALHERRLLRSMPQRTFLIRPRHQGSQFFRAIFPTTNHGQQHGGCKLTVRVVWVMCDAIFCHGGLYMHLLVIYIRSCFL